MDGGWENRDRQEYNDYSNGFNNRRSASAGRLRGLPQNHNLSNSLRPSSAVYGGPIMDSFLSNTSPSPGRGVPGRGLFANRNNLTTVYGWADNGGSPAGGKRMHAQALAGAMSRESLAEELTAVRNQLSQAKEVQKRETTQRRQVEQELHRVRQSLLKAEEVMGTRERQTTSPNMGISQLYRSPDTTHLVAALKEQVRELRSSKEQADTQLRVLNTSLRATRTSELQADHQMAKDELERQAQLLKVMDRRLQEAELVVQSASSEAVQARRALHDYTVGEMNGDANTMRAPAGTAAIAGSSVRRTLQAMHAAHKALIGQAALLRQVFPPGMGMEELSEKAKQRPNTAGAPDVLNFLRNHTAKLSNELTGMPGGPAPPAVVTPVVATRAVQPSSTPPAPPPGRVHPDQMLKTVADGVRKLRVLDANRWADNAESQLQSEQLADVMRLYVDEVDRLGGRPSVSAPAVRASPVPVPVSRATPPSREEPPSQQAQLALIDAQAALARARADAASTADIANGRENSLQATLADLKEQLRQANEARAAPAIVEATVTKEASVQDAIVEEAAVAVVVAEDQEEYKVVVVTSNVSGGAFDGQAWISLQSKDICTSELLLPSNDYNFDNGQVDEFTVGVPVAALPVGAPLTQVGLRMSASERGDETWHVKCVEVTPPGQATQVFLLDDWVRPDGTTWLFPLAPANSRVAYEVTINTSDCRGASAEGQVYIQFVGDLGATQQVLVTPEMCSANTDANTLWTRGSVATLVVPASDVGDVSHVVLKLAAPEGGELHSGWHLDTVEVLHPGTGWASTMYFYDWINAKEPRAVLFEASTWEARVPYDLEVHTSVLKGADFKGQVFVTVNGWYGSTAEMPLLGQDGKEVVNFCEGSCEEFSVRAINVGPFSSITLRAVASNADNVTWHVDRVLVKNRSIDETATFQCNNWFTEAQPSLTIYKDTSQIEYSLTVMAADGATFWGGLTAVLSGMYGSSVEVPLVNSNADGSNSNNISFAPGVPQDFKFNIADVGVLTSVEVKAVAGPVVSGMATTVKLEYLQVECPGPDSTKKSAKFLPKADEASLDGTTVGGARVVLPRDLPTVEYSVVATTCDSPYDAGFDGKVLVRIKGLDGTTEEVELTGATMDGDATAPFAMGAISTFKLTAADVGIITSLEVRMVGLTDTTYWRPARLDVTNKITGQTAVYRYNSWMSTWSGAYTMEQQTITNWQVKLHNSTSPGQPTFKGKVFVKLDNGYCCSDEVEVSSGALLPGAITEPFSLSCPLSYLQYANVRVEGSSAPLCLRMVELINDSAGGTSTYFNNRGNPLAGKESVQLSSDTLVDYTFSLNTLPGQGAGLDAAASVYVQLLGDGDVKGEEVALPLPDTGCPPGSTVAITVKTFVVQPYSSIKLRVVGGQGPWALQRITVSDNYYCTNVLHNVSGKVAASGSVTLVKLQDVQYVIKTTTSDKAGADTDGELVVRLLGSKADSEPVWLIRSMPCEDADKALHALDRGAVNTFYISAVDVGEVQGVAISLATATDYNPVHSGLHLAGIAVLQTITGKETHFDHNKWVDASAPEVSLSGGSTSMSYVEWVVTVVTGSSGQLYGKLLASFKGSDGQRTHKMALDPSEAVIKTVAGGTQHTFKVLAASLTDISSMEVEMWSESIDYWMELVRVQAVVTSTRVMCLIKAAQQTMYRWNGSSTFNVAPCDVYYSITATTGPESSSRWDGSAYVTLHGADGDAPEHQLTSWDCSEFSLGANNSFYFYECDVGTIQAVTIRTEPGSGSCKAWGLAYLDVTAYPSTGTRQAGFEPSQPVRANTAVRVERVVSITSYEITVTTSDLPGAGTDGRVFIKLVGAQGESEEVQLINGPEDFTRNATSVFTIQTSDVGDCREVAVRLEGDKNSGKLHSSWNCSSIQVLSTSSGMSFGFSAHQWIVREAGTAHLSQTSATQALSPYTVRVTTGTTKGASFEGEAFVVFKTWWGDSKEVRLAMPSRQKAEFRAGETAEFTVYAPKQWPPYAMDLRCVPTERDPMWNVERVVVVDPSSGDTVEFIGKTWLDKETSSVQLSSYCTPTQWKVVVCAGSAPDAGWDGSVWIMLEGVNGTSTYHLLNNDSGSAIIAGSASEFLVDLEDVGVPRRVQLKVEGGSAEGAARKWLCEHLEVTRVDTGRTWMFSNSTWADAGEVPLTLEVVLPPTEYSLVVTTSGQESDAFDGDAYVQIFGVDGSSEEHKLVLAGEVGGRPTFDLGSIVTCAFTTGDVGEIQYVSLRMDATGSKTTWGVTVVELTNTASNYRVRMPFGSQLNSNWYSCTNLCPERETVHKLLVVTKGQPEASWDGAVYFTLGNGWQNGKETRLLNDKGSDAFKAGASEEFTISSTDISWANQLKLRLEGGSTSSWGLERIELWNTTEVQTVSARVLLPQQPLTVDTEGITLSSVQRRTYPTVTLRMAADSEPFDGTVFLQLADSVGNVSNEVTLLAGGTHMLDAGTSVDLDSTSLFLNNPPTQALLRAERAGTASTWKPQSLSLVDDGCSSLLFVTQTSQTATLPSTLTLKGLKGVTYQVTVSTADLIGNGTDGAVYLTLTGEQGVSVERQLSNINLERGHTDFTNLELPDLGPLTSIKLVHKDGGAGVHSAWYCDTLDVLLVESGMQTRFAPAQWLEAGGEAVLEASGPAIQTYVPYEVTVVTQNSEGNGFDGVVQIMLEDLDVGQRTHTFLVGDGHSAGTTTGPFAPGASTTCSVLARDLGNVGRVHVQIVGTDNSNNWGLAEVVVKNIDRDQTWRFTYNSSMYSWYGWQPVELAPLDAPEELLVDLPAPTPERQASIPAPAEHEPEFPVVLAKEEEVEAEVEESPAPSEQSFAASEQRLSAPEVVPTPSDQFFSTAAPAPEPPPEKKGFFAGLGWGSKKADPTAKEPPAVEPPPEALMSPIVDQQPATSDAEVLRVVTPEASRTSAPAPEAPEVLAALLDEEESIAQEEPASPPDDEPEPLDEAAPPSDEEQAAPIEEEEEEGEAPAEAAADAPKEEAPPTPSAAPPEMLAEAFSKPTRMVDPLAEEDSMDDPFDNATVNDGLDSEFSRY